MCGATRGGPDTAGLDVASHTVLQGVVLHADVPVPGAYVRLLDAEGEFTAEVPTSATGQFRFFASPGSWTLRALAPGGLSAASAAHAEKGVTDVVLDVRPGP